MANNQKYEYTDETSIYPDLMCVICSEPFQDPVCTPCDHTFCRHCIQHWIDSEDLSCPICRKTLLIIQLKQANRIILNMLDRIHVKCLACGQTGLQRGTFYFHMVNECPKSNVNCLSSNIQCSWVGQRDELEGHLKTCVFYLFEPFLNDISYENEKIKQEIFNLERIHIENNINQTNHLENLRESCDESMDEIDERLIVNENQIENHEYQLVDYPIQIIHCFDRLNQIEIDNQDFLQSNQNEIDIQQLTIKLNLLKELLNDYRNTELEECIDKRESNSWIDLSRRQLTDRDMDIIVQQAMINKQCKELDLRRNEIQSNGIGILADQLIQNQILEILYLSFNFISDMGVYYLMESMSNNYTKLKKLELDSNEITDQGAKYLSEILKINSILTWLSLDNNKITNQGMKSIADVLSHSNQRLEELYMNGNKSIDDQSINSLSSMIKQNSIIRKFSLENCGFFKRGKMRLQQISKHKKNFSLII